MSEPVRSASVSHRSTRRLSRAFATVAAVVAAAVLGVAFSPGADRSVEAVGGPLGSGGEYQGINPDRIYDSRKTSPRLPMTASTTGSTVDFDVAGTAGLPPFVDADNDGQDDNVLAVVVNITVIEPTHVGYLRAFGTGSPEGGTSVVNFVPGAVVPNTAIIRPGDLGKISMRLVSPTAPGTADVAVDITGWFSTTAYGQRGDRVISIDPIRVYDSDLPQFGGVTLKGRQQKTIPIRGAAEVSAPNTVIVPDDPSVVGVIANITGVNAFGGSQQTYLSALPDPVAQGQVPTTSTVNLLAGQTRANMAILPVGDDGAIRLFNLQGEVRMVVDVVAYLKSDMPVETRAGRVIPLLSPFRTFDTRHDDFGAQPLGPAEAEDFSFESFVNDVSIDSQAVGEQSALIGNLTATGLQRQYPWAPAASFVTAFPSPGESAAVPVVSNLNILENDTVANLALIPYGESSQGPYSIRFYNRAGYVDYLLDAYAVVLGDDT